MNITHAFVNDNGQLLHPVKAILSYGILDQLLDKSHRDIQSIVDKLKVQIEGEEGECQYDNTALLGTVIHHVAESASCYKKDMTMKAMKHRRPLHYRDNDHQCVYWVSGKSPTDDIVTKPYAVIFDTVDKEKEGEQLVLHESAEEAVNALIDQKQKEGSSSIPIDGFNQTYFKEFGGSRHYLNKHCKLRSLSDERKLDRAESANGVFMEWLNQGFTHALREAILARSKLDVYGWTTLSTSKGKFKIPTLPLMAWALRKLNEDRYSGEDWVEYAAVSDTGVKTNNDDPLHTDWMIGGGVDLDYDKSREVLEEADRWAFYWQSAKFQVKNHVLNVGKDVKGRLFHATPSNAGDVQEGDILVLPKGSEDYHIHAMKACGKGRGGVITEVGGKSAHLVKVGRELGFNVLRIPDARKTLPHHAYAHLSSKRGEVYLEQKEEVERWLRDDAC
tara:strand:- start:7171 stop:8508 length:1338 start_codon:yes stop_codon:yes gene_type:complete